MLYCDIVVSEFELKLRYYIPFRTNTHEKDMNHLIRTSKYSLNGYTVQFFYKDGFDIKKLVGWLVGWLVEFYGVSTFVGYLTLNSVYMYIHSTKDFWTNTK